MSGGIWSRDEMRYLSPPEDPYCERCDAYLDAESRTTSGGRCDHCAYREPCDSCDEYVPETDLDDGLCEACAEEAMRCGACHDLPDDGLDEDGLCAACAEAT